MTGYEVAQPILCGPYDEPTEHWRIVEGETPVRVPGRRPAMYFYRAPEPVPTSAEGGEVGTAIELKLVNLIRQRLKEWRRSGCPGVTRTTLELLNYWVRDGREHRLFFAQLEAAETVIFLAEARADFLQGIEIPPDEPGEDRKTQGHRAFKRLGCKMATGTGKTTLMAMLAAWSILNKVNDRSDARFSDVVLVVCPNVTIRNRLREIDPNQGEASLYVTRDLVPRHLLSDLTKGRVLVTNWHVFEPQAVTPGGVSAKVSRAGVPLRLTETIWIGTKTTTARGRRYLTTDELDRQVAAGLVAILEEDRDRQGALRKVRVESVRYVESDTALVNRVLAREVGGKQNILVFNDEAHHAYRIRREEEDASEEELFAEAEDREDFFKEATVWIDGLDRIHKLRGINFCVDLSATPYFLARVGQDTNRIFPWVVSDFRLTDAIESGLVKIPQLAVRDTTGAEIPGYFNIWRWILPRLTPAERGASRGSPKPEAIVKWAATPIAMLGGLWEQLRAEWEQHKDDTRPPVFIIVCKNTAIAKVIYEWLALDKPPVGIPPANIPGFRNENGRINTIRVDSKVVHETDSDQAKSDDSTWMRLTLDTVGRTDWPRDRQGRPVYPEGFEELAKKRKQALHPPGRDVRCIVSVGMLTEGWDCNTVTHILGLRPFMSQRLCYTSPVRDDALPLDGLLVLDLTRVLAGPYCTRLLADLGARVIKVERPGEGDEMRRGPHQLEPGRDDQSTYFTRVNAGKESVALDLAHPRGREVLLDLARPADVFVENFTPGVVSKLGCDYAAVRAVKPDIVYCSISGFGQTGPWRLRPAFAHIVNAISGLMYLEQGDEPAPRASNLQAADVLAATHACSAILAALWRRGRTGRGAHLDVSMLEALVAADSITFGSVLNGGEEHGNPRPGLLVYRVGGRYLAFQIVGAPQIWPRLLAVMGRPELGDDPRFATALARRRNSRELREVIGQWLSRFGSIEEALEVLSAARIPCAPVLRPAELIAEPHLAQRGFFPAVPHPTHGSVRVTASPYHMDGKPVHPRGPAAYRVGEHTRDVLTHLLGYDAARIAELGAAGVIEAP